VCHTPLAHTGIRSIPDLVGCILFSMRKHGKRGRLAYRWMCGLMLICVRTMSEMRNLKVACAHGLLAIVGVPQDMPSCVRDVLPSLPSDADAPKLGIMEGLHKRTFMTHSQLLKGLKCEPKWENDGRRRNRSTLPNSQHFEG